MKTYPIFVKKGGICIKFKGVFPLGALDIGKYAVGKFKIKHIKDYMVMNKLVSGNKLVVQCVTKVAC